MRFFYDRGNNNLNHCSFVYAHGEAELIGHGLSIDHPDGAAPDIVVCDADISELAGGSYPCEYEGIPAVLVISWRPYQSGRIALIRDTDNLRHALTPEEWR